MAGECEPAAGAELRMEDKRRRTVKSHSNPLGGGACHFASCRTCFSKNAQMASVALNLSDGFPTMASGN